MIKGPSIKKDLLVIELLLNKTVTLNKIIFSLVFLQHLNYLF